MDLTRSASLTSRQPWIWWWHGRGWWCARCSQHTAGLQQTPLLASGTARDAPSPKASALEDCNIPVKEALAFRKAGHYSREAESSLEQLWAGNTADSRTVWHAQEFMGPGKHALRQNVFWAAGFSNSNGMWCFYLSPGRQRAGFHLVFLCIQGVHCSVPELAVCSATRAVITFRTQNLWSCF